MRNISLVFILSSLMVLGCKSQTNFQDSTAEIKRTFGANIPDTQLEFNPQITSLKASLTKNSFTASSYEILKLSDLLLNSPLKSFKDQGFSLSDIYSHPGRTASLISSEVSPPGNPYTEQAFIFLKPLLISQYTVILSQAQEKVVQAADGLNIKTVEDPNSNSSYYLSQIIFQLTEFNRKLSMNSDPQIGKFLTPIIDEINTNYIKPLTDLTPKLVWQPSQRLDVFLDTLKKEIPKIPGLSEAEKLTCGARIVEAIDYAKQAEEIEDTASGIKLIVDLWLNKSNRSHANPEMMSLLRPMTEKNLLALASDNKPLFDATAWKALKARKDFENMTSTELVGLASYNGAIMGEEEWLRFNGEKVKKMILSCKSCSIAWNETAGLTDREKIRSIAVYWLNLKIRYTTFPDSLISGFKGYEDDQIEYLRNNSTAWLAVTAPESAFIRYQIGDYIESYTNSKNEKADKKENGVRNFKIAMSRKIFEAVDRVLKEKIQGLSANLKQILKTEIIARLEVQKEKFVPMAFENFKDYAKKYLNQWFFFNKELGLFEPSAISFDKGSYWALNAQVNQTTSEVIGASLSHHILKINNSRNDEEAKLSGFKLVSKIAALAGYRNYENKLSDSLTMSLSRGYENQRFDVKTIKTYNPKVSVFAVPDKVYLKELYKADLERSRADAEVSVLGQMELLKGYVASMTYLKPWMKTKFDTSLSKLRIELFPDEEIFAKQQLFKQSLVLSLSVMFNLRDKMVGIYNSKNQFLDGFNSQDRVAAAVFGFTRDRAIHRVKTEEVAQTLIALSDFVEVTSDIKQIRDSDIDASAIQMIEDARTQTRSLITGLSLFVTGTLMNKDGSFVDGLDLNSKQPFSKTKRLFDQLIMQKALLRAADLLNLDFLRFRVFDNYFFLNGNMWNAQTGFYKDSTSYSSKTVSLRNLLLAVENLEEMIPTLTLYARSNPALNPSLEQIKFSLEYWKTRHLSGATISQNVVELLLPQEAVFRR